VVQGQAGLGVLCLQVSPLAGQVLQGGRRAGRKGDGAWMHGGLPKQPPVRGLSVHSRVPAAVLPTHPPPNSLPAACPRVHGLLHSAQGACHACRWLKALPPVLRAPLPADRQQHHAVVGVRAVLPACMRWCRTALLRVLTSARSPRAAAHTNSSLSSAWSLACRWHRRTAVNGQADHLLIQG
jgi:hypothetical protein